MRKFLMIYGTRPEVIKLIPLINEMRKHPKKIELTVCNMGQHTDLIKSEYAVNDFKPDLGFKVMVPNQSLAHITVKVLNHTHEILNKIFKPDAVIVQGDTTTAFAAALAAYSSSIPVIHVEAGLRTGNFKNPYPEEFNRYSIDSMSSLFFAPTENNKETLLKEDKKRIVRVVGNTVIDALKTEISKMNAKGICAEKKKQVVITLHRRESFPWLKSMFKTIVAVSESHQDYEFIFVRHPNPNVEKAISLTVSNKNNCTVLTPMNYASFLKLLISSSLIMTDSGGIVEEAVSINVPVVILRVQTERYEAIEVGAAVMAGTDQDSIFFETDKILNNKDVMADMSAPEIVNPFGDGTASKQITEILLKEEFSFLP